MTLGGAVLLVVAGIAGLWTGPMGALAVALAGTWPMARLRDRVQVRDDGLAVGPGWTPVVPWHEVHGVRLVPGARRSMVVVRTVSGAQLADVATAVLPALRARLRRQGALALDEGAVPTSERYARWRTVASAVPWGVLVGTAVAVSMSPTPWTTCLAGLLTMAATALLAAAVEARAAGWGAGGVLWVTLAYGVVLIAVGLGLGGWVGGS